MERPTNFQQGTRTININTIERRPPLRETSAGDTATNALQATPIFPDRVAVNERFIAMATRSSSAQASEQRTNISTTTQNTVPTATSALDPEAEEPYVSPSFVDEVPNLTPEEERMVDNVIASAPQPSGTFNNLASERISILVSGAENPQRENLLAVLSQVESPGVGTNVSEGLSRVRENTEEVSREVEVNRELAREHDGITASLTANLAWLDTIVRAHPVAVVLTTGTFILVAVGGIYYFCRRSIGGSTSVPVSVSNPVSPTINPVMSPTINITVPPPVTAPAQPEGGPSW